jgi:hypothetical protein
VVGGELAISWIRVLKVEGGAIPVRANSLCASGVWAGNCKMSNTRGVSEMEAEGRAIKWQRRGGREWRLVVVKKGRMCVKCWIPIEILGR